MMSNGADILARFRTYLEAGADDYDFFDTIRQLIASSEDYQPYSDELATVAQLLDDQLYDRAQEHLDRSTVNLLLSPRAHLLQASIAKANDDEDRVEDELLAAAACLRGIASSGDGSRERPYRVLRTSDEYDVLQSIDSKMQQQELIHQDDRHFDVITCADGRRIWFDITDAYRRLGRLMGD